MLAVLVGVRAEHIAINRRLDVLEENQLPAGYVVCKGSYHGKPVLTCRTGMGEDRVAGILGSLIDENRISAIVSARMASGIPPDLAVGDLAFCPRTQLWQKDSGLRRSSGECDLRLLEMAGRAATRAGIRHMVGDCLTVAPLKPQPLERDSLGKRPNLAVVDTEGYWIANAALAAGLPFISVRVSFGDVFDQMPEALSMVGKQSYVSKWSMLRQHLAHPTRLPNFMKVAQAVRTCGRSLYRFFGPFLDEWETQGTSAAERLR